MERQTATNDKGDDQPHQQFGFLTQHGDEERLRQRWHTAVGVSFFFLAPISDETVKEEE